jgi:prevent-host-death family protein
MKTASITEIKANFASYINESEHGAVVVTRNGRPVAVLLGVQDDDELERIIMAHSRKLRAILDAAHAQIKAGHGIPHDEFWKQVEAESAEPHKPEKALPKVRGRKPRKS